MSHPIRNQPHIAHAHQQNRRNRRLNRIDEEPANSAEHDHPHLPEMSINSNHFQTPPSSQSSSTKDSASYSSDDEDEHEGVSYSTSINGPSRDAAILLPNHQLVSKEMLQRKLRFHFMSPIDKWRLKRRFPLKLCFQLVKIVLVTMQILYFGNEMSRFLAYEDNSLTAFREMLLEGWDPTREIYAYPPSTGIYAVYTSDAFYSSLDFAVHNYVNLTRQSVGTFGFVPSALSEDSPLILLEWESFKKRSIDPAKYIFTFNDEVVRRELAIDGLYPATDPRWALFQMDEYLKSQKCEINFNELISFRLKFPLRTIYFNADLSTDTVRCYDLNVTLWYDNREHDGQMPVQLSTERRIHECKSSNPKGKPDFLEDINIYHQNSHTFNWPLFLNCIVMLFCVLSIVLCARSLYRGQLLRAETDQFFYNCFERRLTFAESMEFCDLWIVMIGINDVLITAGTLMKIRLENSDIINSRLYTDCSLMLGIGNLLVWLGLLRYLSYFNSYNILIITIRKSMPNILRFLFCAILIYSGFCFCGWVVLGPYHLKFRTLSSTSECLFSLMNGDDMFATFFSTDVASHTMIWWFSRIYFYLFISLAIYVIVSLFIAIILDSYESIRDYYSKETDDLKSPLQKFIEEYPVDSVDGSNFTNNSIVDHIHRHLTRCCTFWR